MPVPAHQRSARSIRREHCCGIENHAGRNWWTNRGCLKALTATKVGEWMRSFYLPHKIYNIGSLAGRGPKGKALSMRVMSAADNWKSPAPAFSAAGSGVEALGMVKSPGQRTRNWSAI